MAEGAQSSEIHWYDPAERGVFPLQGFHISRSLRRSLLRGDYDIRINSDFLGTMQNCANRKDTWINQEIYDLYTALHGYGFAHSLEVWREGEMIGGVYGVSLGAAFCGESMFSTKTDASKIALAYLIHRLNLGGVRLFDTQFLTPHLASLGAIEIEGKEYHRQLAPAIHTEANFTAPETPTPQKLVSDHKGVA